MTYKFFNIIDYSILGFQHLIYVLECIYTIILYQYRQLVTLLNKFSTISLILELSNVLRSLLIRYIHCTFQTSPEYIPAVSQYSNLVDHTLLPMYFFPYGLSVPTGISRFHLSSLYLCRYWMRFGRHYQGSPASLPLFSQNNHREHE